MTPLEVVAVNFREMTLTALPEVCHGYGRGLRDLVNRYNPNVSTDNFPVILGRDGTGAGAGSGQAGDHGIMGSPEPN